MFYIEITVVAAAVTVQVGLTPSVINYPNSLDDVTCSMSWDSTHNKGGSSRSHQLSVIFNWLLQFYLC